MRVHGIRLVVPADKQFDVTDPAGALVVKVDLVTWIHGDEAMACTGLIVDLTAGRATVDVPMEEMPTWVAVAMLEETTGEAWRR